MTWHSLKKIIPLLIACLITTTLTACNQKANKASGDMGNSDDPYAKLPKEISAAIFDRGKVPAQEGSYEDNRWTKWIEKESGIHIKWIPIPRNEYKEKYNTLIASGEAPDLIVEYDANFIANLIEQGVVQPVDDYINKYSTTYKKYIEQHPELEPYVKSKGKTYAFTSKRDIGGIVNHGMWIRQDWLDKLNLKAPTTDEELLEVARKFKDNDPDGNGANDTYGLAIMNWHEIFPSMYFASGIWYNENGQLKYGHTLDRYGDAIGFLKKLFDDKLISNEFITDKNFQQQKQLWITGKAGILTSTWNDTINSDLMQNNPAAKPVPLEPVQTKYGKNGLWQETPAAKYVVFSKDMKNPKAGVEFLDWMIDKGWFTLTFGQEGVHYKSVNGVPQVIDAAKNKQELEYAGDYPVLQQWNLKPEWIPLMAAQDQKSQEFAKLKAESLQVALKNKFRRDLPYDPPLPEVTKIMSEFGPKRDEIRMKIIVGGPQYTSQWGIQQIREEWNRLGGADVEKKVNEWYQQNKQNLEQ